MEFDRIQHSFFQFGQFLLLMCRFKNIYLVLDLKICQTPSSAIYFTFKLENSVINIFIFNWKVFE